MFFKNGTKITVNLFPQYKIQKSNSHYEKNLR